MIKNNANGPADCLVTEMAQCLPVETVYEVAHWFAKRFRGECRAPEAWKILRLVFLKMPDAKPETGLRGFRAIALRSVFSEWKTTVQADLLHEEKEPIEWMSLHAEAERGVGGPLDRFGTRISTTTIRLFMASLDVKKAFEVTKPSMVSRILSMTGVHGHVAAALQLEMHDVQGSFCFEKCETEFRYSRCIRQGGVELHFFVWTRGQRRFMERRGKVKDQRMGTVGERQRVRVTGHDVGRQLLVLL